MQAGGWAGDEKSGLAFLKYPVVCRCFLKDYSVKVMYDTSMMDFCNHSILVDAIYYRGEPY